MTEEENKKKEKPMTFASKQNTSEAHFASLSRTWGGVYLFLFAELIGIDDFVVVFRVELVGHSVG